MHIVMHRVNIKQINSPQKKTPKDMPICRKQNSKKEEESPTIYISLNVNQLNTCRDRLCDWIRQQDSNTCWTFKFKDTNRMKVLRLKRHTMQMVTKRAGIATVISDKNAPEEEKRPIYTLRKI